MIRKFPIVQIAMIRKLPNSRDYLNFPIACQWPGKIKVYLAKTAWLNSVNILRQFTLVRINQPSRMPRRYQKKGLEWGYNIFNLIRVHLSPKEVSFADQVIDPVLMTLSVGRADDEYQLEIPPTLTIFFKTRKQQKSIKKEPSAQALVKAIRYIYT